MPAMLDRSIQVMSYHRIERLSSLDLQILKLFKELRNVSTQTSLITLSEHITSWKCKRMKDQRLTNVNDLHKKIQQGNRGR